jgi:hypothetical protein
MIDTTLSRLAPYRRLFCQDRSWFCFCLYVLVCMARCQSACVTGLISEFVLKVSVYDRFLRLFAALAAVPDEVEAIHVRNCLKHFCPQGRPVLLVDSTIVCKEGRRMPGVSSQVQSSSSNSKREFVMAHDIENIALCVKQGDEQFAVPLISYIRNGAVHSNRSTKTALDHVVDAICKYPEFRGAVAVVDCYYASAKLARKLIADHEVTIVTRVKSNSVAYAQPGKRKTSSRGRPRLYGEKVYLRNLRCRTPFSFSSMSNGQEHLYVCHEQVLIHKGYGGPMRYIRVERDGDPQIVLMSNDFASTTQEIVELYVNRWRIEEMIKENKSLMDFGNYRFWTSVCPKSSPGRKVYTHRMTAKARQTIRFKEAVYRVYLILTNISATQLHIQRHLAPSEIWSSFPGWIRTIRPGMVPSIRVTKEAFKYELYKYCKVGLRRNKWTKYLCSCLAKGSRRDLKLTESKAA